MVGESTRKFRKESKDDPIRVAGPPMVTAYRLEQAHCLVRAQDMLGVDLASPHLGKEPSAEFDEAKLRVELRIPFEGVPPRHVRPALPSVRRDPPRSLSETLGPACGDEVIQTSVHHVDVLIDQPPRGQQLISVHNRVIAFRVLKSPYRLSCIV